MIVEFSVKPATAPVLGEKSNEVACCWLATMTSMMEAQESMAAERGVLAEEAPEATRRSIEGAWMS